MGPEKTEVATREGSGPAAVRVKLDERPGRSIVSDNSEYITADDLIAPRAWRAA